MAFNITNATMSTMRAVAWFGQPYNVSTDVVVRITSSAICGSDLHMYHGFGGSPNVPYGFGHEAVGYVSSVGDAVSSLEVGDYVIIPDNADDGHWGPSHPLSFGVGSANYGGLQVAIFGAGPVGLLAAYSAKLRGASRVYVVDRIASRLEQAGSLGAIPIDFSQQDPVEAILSREPAGVTRSLDCVGFESVNATGGPHNGIVLENMVAVTAVYGGMGIGGVYNGGGNSTEGAPNAGNLPAEIPIPMASLWRKGLSVGTGIVLPLLRAPPLLDLISSGVAKPSFVVTAEIGIEDAPEYYRRYSDHLENKVVIRFP
ncbi:alcohol dehydrogenase GroES-like domain-containing protein [Colletotrichum scovillei]|uniref:alcohol dehydrogenase GroES-like domain-containing protein n=1 Tax=Colletotrichum scovillei TaxID=1209932 RepID=UPI0015C39E63|nr:alcohol dehydrogenase GroES-like domain-containing protein [Colletotrichum scovillei]KAF4776643.1 alcohol dehydrogenase GroES-like domain-containing protein [Colletotrichum scovillei]